MFEALAQALAAGLQLWKSAESRKYVDKLMALRKAYHEEFNKDDDHRSDAVLSNIEWELRNLAVAFSATVGKQGPADQ